MAFGWHALYPKVVAMRSCGCVWCKKRALNSWRTKWIYFWYANYTKNIKLPKHKYYSRFAAGGHPGQTDYHRISSILTCTFLTSRAGSPLDLARGWKWKKVIWRSKYTTTFKSWTNCPQHSQQVKFSFSEYPLMTVQRIKNLRRKLPETW